MKMREIHRMPLCAVLIIAGMCGAHPPGWEKIPLALRVALDAREGNEATLKAAGYPVDTVAQLQEAAKNGKRSSVRWSALYLLAARVGQDGIPVFKESLKDPDYRVRMTGAVLLGAFGDKSGIAVLRRDLATFAPRNGEPDPNLMKLQGEELMQAKRRNGTQMMSAIRVAEALSRLGDASGLTLAARVALEGESAAQRSQAIATLASLVVEAASDKSILAGQTIDPEAVLLAAAESETEHGVITTMMGHAARLPREKARRMYEKLIASPHPTEKDREMMKGILRLYDREAKKQSKAQSTAPKKQ
jgi:hypothetical protein